MVLLKLGFEFRFIGKKQGSRDGLILLDFDAPLFQKQVNKQTFCSDFLMLVLVGTDLFF